MGGAIAVPNLQELVDGNPLRAPTTFKSNPLVAASLHSLEVPLNASTAP